MKVDVLLLTMITLALLAGRSAVAGVTIDMPPAPASDAPATNGTAYATNAPGEEATVGSIALARYAHDRVGTRDVVGPVLGPWNYRSYYGHGYGYPFYSGGHFFHGFHRFHGFGHVHHGFNFGVRHR